MKSIKRIVVTTFALLDQSLYRCMHECLYVHAYKLVAFVSYFCTNTVVEIPVNTCPYPGMNGFHVVKVRSG